MHWLISKYWECNLLMQHKNLNNKSIFFYYLFQSLLIQHKDKFTNEPRKVWTNNLNWINNLLYSRTGAHYWLNWNNPKRTRTRMNGLMLRNIFESSYCQCWFMNTGWIQKPTVVNCRYIAFNAREDRRSWLCH